MNTCQHAGTKQYSYFSLLWLPFHPPRMSCRIRRAQKYKLWHQSAETGHHGTDRHIRGFFMLT
jgi:hypothetical protein